MSPVLFAILVFLSIVLFTAGALAAFATQGDAERRRIALRLANKRMDLADPEYQTVLLRQHAGALDELFGHLGFLKQLRASLKQAMPDVSAEKFLVFASVCALLTGTACSLVTASVFVGGIGFLTGGYLPFVVLAKKKSSRQKRINEQLPDALDFLGRTLRAGHSLPVGLQMMGGELPSPLSDEFQRCYDEISLGTGPDVALKSMIERIDSTDFAFFVTAVLVQRQTGGDLAHVLDNITDMLRQRIQLQQQLKARTAQGRFTGLILAAFPMVMFLLLVMMNSNYMVMVTTNIGKTMLAVSLGMSIVGLIVIRKIVHVEV